jgi:hypothetical protein
MQWLFKILNDMTYQLSIDSSNKLKCTTRWMTDLRRKVELFNRCVEQCENANSMRMEMSEIFSPILAILHESIKYLQMHITGKLDRIARLRNPFRHQTAFH